MWKKVITMIGIRAITTQAPWMNLLTAMSTMTTPAVKAPRPLTAAFKCTRAAEPFSFIQCTTIPA